MYRFLTDDLETNGGFYLYMQIVSFIWIELKKGSTVSYMFFPLKSSITC